MKVGIDVSSVVYGTGVSDYTLELVRHLPPEVVVPVGFSLRRQGDLKRLVPNCTTYPIPPTALHYLWNKFHVLNFENFAPGRIDVYHSSDWAQGPDSHPKVTTVHDLAPLLYPEETTQGIIRNIVSAHTARLHWVTAECDRIICVSRSTEADLLRLFPKTKGRTLVIPEALPSRFLLKPQAAKHRDYLLAIGARQPRKNIPKLISAYTRFGSKYHLPEKLVIVGEKSDSVSQTPNSVLFTCYISDQEMVNYLAGASAFVFPSLHEGFGLPILGAFHHHVPVACSDIPVFRETAGSAAQFFDPQDEESIALGIAAAIKNRTKLTKAGTAQLAKFSWAKAASETLKIYQSLC